MHPLIRLQPKQDRRLKSGHPWAFSNELATTPEHRAWLPGGVVRIEGDDGWRYGTFMFNPRSLIAARMLDRDPGAEVGAAWVRARLAEELLALGFILFVISFIVLAISRYLLRPQSFKARTTAVAAVPKAPTAPTATVAKA